MRKVRFLFHFEIHEYSTSFYYRKEILLHYLYWKHIVDRTLFVSDGMVGHKDWQNLWHS